MSQTIELEITRKEKVAVRYLQAECGVRYWEDATVDGVKDTHGSLVPCREGDNWCPIINLETGKIENWKPGVVADIHYKVCDEGRYTLLNEAKEEVRSIDGYVLSMLAPKSNGHGDYVIMDVNADGVIQSWHPDLSEFEEER